MAMKNLSFLAVLSLLALTLPLAIASDPSPLQDFCVGVNTPSDGVFVNGKFCKDPKLVTVDDFFMAGLQNARPVANVVGSNVTAVNVNNLPGLNTLGISLVRIDYGVNGQNPPHTHPRATEILYVGLGQLLVGFVTSNGDGNRMFTKTLNEGDVFVFPEGLIHFQFNVGRFPAVAFAALSSQNPGVVTIANSVFGSNPAIDPNVLARAFQLDPKFKRGIRTPLHGRLGAKPKSVGFVQTILEKGNMVVTFCSGEARVLASEVVKLIPLDGGQHVRLRKDVREPIT
ncbi:germin-like protein subfamily 1 member 11 [Brassica napus]|uniref:germin-like protein subfamily 1 member 11 n=1 Tax=Brassica napus TaxID=3708 RepID=UPI002078D64B|nr:germin-like protein subfamily 1 member 11 [Brassica napus]